MISLSREWAALSRAMYGQEFIDELANLLRENKVRTILECGCGDGHILRGLAEQGFVGVGIDTSLEMIALALKNNQHFNISYEQMNWLDIADKIKAQFDAVMCRGNSLSAVSSWDNPAINPLEARKKIEESVGLFFERLKKGGLLYVDAVSQSEADRIGRVIEIKAEGVDLRGKIEYDLQNRTRRVFGEGKVLGEDFEGGSVSYLLMSDELEGIVRKLNPSHVWRPKLEHEINYDLVCAVK